VHTPRQTTLYLLVFSFSRWCSSLLSGLFLPVFYIFHPNLVVDLAHLGVQARVRRSTGMRRPYPSICRLQNVSVVAALCCWHGIFYDVRKVTYVDQAVIDLVESVSIWGVPGLEVDSFVHEVRTFDRHFSACG
jgi:hypothetical protein